MQEIHSQEWFLEAFSISPVPVPDRLSRLSERICREFNIVGSADPMYIVNVAAFELGMGDGSSGFYEKSIASLPSRHLVEKLAARLAFAYSSCIGAKGNTLLPLLIAELENVSMAADQAIINTATATSSSTASSTPHDQTSSYDLKLAVAEMLRRLHECGIPGEQFDLASWVITEYFPSDVNRSGSVYAYQFMKSTSVGEPLRNIATCIPSLGKIPALNLHIPGGRLYTVPFTTTHSIEPQICSALLRMYPGALSVNENDGATYVEPIDRLKIMLQCGVVSTMQELSRLMPLLEHDSLGVADDHHH